MGSRAAGDKRTSPTDGIDVAELARFVHRSRARRHRWGMGGHDASTVAGLEPGERVTLLTDSSASLIDHLEAVIEDAAPCSVDVATWAAYQGDIARVARYQEDGRVSRVRVIVDRGMRHRQVDEFNTILQLWGIDAIRECRIHAKIFCVDGGPGRMWAGQSSMNLNGNSRVENLDITRDDGLATMYREFFDLVFSRVAPGETVTLDPFKPADQQTAMVDPLDALLGWV